MWGYAAILYYLTHLAQVTPFNMFAYRVDPQHKIAPNGAFSSGSTVCLIMHGQRKLFSLVSIQNIKLISIHNVVYVSQNIQG